MSGAAEVRAGVGVARAVGVGPVVAVDYVRDPVEAGVWRAALEHAVDAAAVLVLRGAVVDDDVGDDLDALVVERLDQGLQLRLVAVLGRVEIVQAPRQVACARSHGNEMVSSHRLAHASYTVIV